jgi:hypothetical protein
MRGEGVLTHAGVEGVGGEKGLKMLNLGFKLSDLPQYKMGGIHGGITSSASATKDLKPISSNSQTNMTTSIAFNGDKPNQSLGDSENVRQIIEGTMLELLLKLRRQGQI